MARTAATLFALLLLAAPAQAADRSFGLRYSTNTTGDVFSVGNTLLSCSTTLSTTCAAARAGTTTGQAANNNGYTMQQVDVDTDASTFNSSQATLSLPAGSTVLFAGLYYGARTTAGTGGIAAPNRSQRGVVSFRGPADLVPSSLTATTLDDSSTSGSTDVFNGFVDVTSRVAAQGNGTYTVGNVQAATGVDRYAGWSLVVVVRNASLAARNLAVFDGLQVISTANPDETITVSGFQTPSGGTVRARVGFNSYEGDLGSTGDTAQLNGNNLADPLNPATNFFNSSITRLGTRLTAKNPDYPNQLGFDIDTIDTSGFISPGSTSATVRLTTTQETYIPHVVTTAIDLQQPVVNLTKTVSNLTNGTAGDRRGDVLRYTVTATNTGFDAADAVVIRDAIPAGTTYVAGSLRQTAGPPSVGTRTDAAGDDPAELAAGGGEVVFRVGTGATATSGGRLAATGQTGNTATVQFDVRIGATLGPEDVIRNTATSTDRGATLGDVFSRESETVATDVRAPDLTVAKGLTGSIVGGRDATYTVTATNTGDLPTDGSTITVTDTLDSATFSALRSASGTGWTCSIAGLTATCTRSGELAAGASAPAITLVGAVRPAPPASVTNTATVSAGTGADAVTTNNTGSRTDPVARSADLAVAKTVSASPTIGRTVTFTVTARNDGPSVASGVTVTDTLTGLTDVTATSTKGSCTTAVLCTIGELAVGETATVTIRGTLTGEGGQRTNTASVASSTPDPAAGNDSVTVPFTVLASADVLVQKAVSPATAGVGEDVTFTLTVRNTGPNAATNVRLNEPIPAGLEVVSAPDGCVLQSGTYVCTIPTLSAGASVQRVFVVRPTAAAQGQTRTNTVSVGADQADADPANNTASATVAVRPLADLSLTKTASSGTVAVGGTVAFTLTARNDGPATATNVVLRDALPAGLELVSAPGCTTAGTVVTCTVASLAAGQTVTRTLTVRATSAVAGAQVTNTATVAGDQDDVSTAGNTAVALVRVDPLADLRATKSATPAAADVGEDVRFTIRATNDGPNTATGTVLTDVLPAGLDFVAFDAGEGCTYTAATRTVRCAVGALADRATATRSFVARPTATAAGTTLVNRVDVDAEPADPDAANDSATATVAVDTLADLAIVKTAAPASVPQTTTTTFTFAVRNDGPSPATGVTVQDVLPQGLAFVSSPDGCTYDAASRTVTCAIGALPAGQTVQRRVVVRNESLAPGERRTNTATVRGDQDDLDRADNSSSVDVVAGDAAGYSISKVASPTAPAVGQTTTFRLTAANAGPSAAVGARVVDTVPAGLQIVTATLPAGCTVAGQTVTCELGTLAAGTERVLAVEVVPQRDAAGATIVNTATISSDTQDLAPGDNTAEATIRVRELADVEVEKAGPASLATGATGEYVLTVRNAGPNPATGVVLRDPVPAGLEVVSAPGCTVEGRVVTCAIGSLAVGATAERRITVRALAAGSGTTVTNTASVTADQDADRGARQTASVDTELTPVADLSLEKAGPEAPVAVGGRGTFTLTVRNGGPDTATDVRIVDEVPAGLAVVAADTGCAVAGQVVTCTIGSLAGGGSAARTITVSPDLSRSGQTVVNAATASTATADPDAGDRTDDAPLVVRDTTDLRASITSGDPGPDVGETFTLTLAATNDGPRPATGVTLTTTLPDGLELVAAPGCTVSGRTITCAVPGTLAVGATAERTIQVRATAEAAGQGRSPSVTVDADQDDPTPGNDTASVPVGVQSLADLSVTARAAPATASVGQQVTTTFTVRNDGPNAVLDGTLTVVLPDGVDLVSASAGCTTAGRTVTCAVGTIAAGATADVTLVVAATNAAAGGSVALTGTADSSVADPAPGNDAATATFAVRPRAELALTKAVAPATVRPGQQATFTLTVANSGPSTATGVVLTDTVPDGLAIGALPAGCTRSGQVVTCAIGSLAAGASAVREIPATAGLAAAGQDLTNRARVAGEREDQDPADDVAAATLTVAPAADLQTLASFAPSPVEAGDTTTLTVRVRNDGPSAATGVQVVVDLPAGLELDGTPAGCTLDGRRLTCLVGDVPAGEDALVAVALRPDAEVAGTTQRVEVAATSPTFDPAGADNATQASVVVAALADLAASARFDPSTAGVGDVVPLVLGARNDGPTAAQDVTLVTTIPAGFAVEELPAGCTLSGRTVTCAIGTLADDATASRTLRLRVLEALSGDTVPVQVAVQSPTSDQDAADDTATAELVVRPLAELSVALTAQPGAPAVGQATTYDLQVTNAGPSPATDVVVTIPVPAGMAFVSAEGCTETGGTITCTVDSLASGASFERTIVLRPTAAVAGQAVAVTATVDAATDDRAAADDRATATVQVAGQADLGVRKAADVARADLGEDVTFTLTVRNAGPNPATGVRLTDELPAGLELRTAEGCEADGRTLTCAVGTLAVGAEATRTVVARPTLAGTGRTLTNVVTARSDLEDPRPADDTARADVAVDPVADLSVAKTASTSTPEVGDTVTYTVVATNDGPQDATQVTLVDQVPADLRLVAPPAGCTFDGGLLTCDLGTVAAGERVTRTYSVRVGAGAADQRRTNRVAVDALEDDPTPADDQAAAELRIGTLAGLSVDVGAVPGTPAVGEDTTLTVTARNDGPNAAAGVVLRTTVPEGLTIVRVPDGCTVDGRVVTCTVGTLADDATRSFALVVRPTRELAGRLAPVVATVTSTTTDENAEDNRAEATLAVDAVADLSLEKTASPEAPRVGDLLTYALTVRNAGPNAATGVTVLDRLPADLRFVRADDGCTELDGRVRCEVGDLAAGSSAVREVVVRVGAGAGGEPRTNAATVSGDQDDLDAADDRASATVTPVPLADVDLDKVVTPSTVSVGETATFVLTATNAGPNAAIDVVLRDELPAGLEVVDLADGCTLAGRVVTCRIARLDASGDGATASRGIVVRPVAGVSGEALRNDARASSDVLDPDADDDRASAVLRVRELADLSVTKVADRATVPVGEDVTFTLTARNAGPDTATGVVLTDVLPEGLAFVSASGGCAPEGRTVTCPVADLAPGAEATRTITARARAAAGETTQRNVATVDADQDDQTPDDDRAAAEVAVSPLADLQLLLATDPGRARVGQAVLLTGEVRNDGPNVARDVVVTIPIPEGLAIETASAECEIDAATSTVTCRLGDLPADGTQAFTISVTARPQAGVAGTTVVVSGTVAAATDDPRPADNEDETALEVAPLADLGITKAISDPTPAVGDTVTFTLTVTNAGPNTATGVRVTDALPEGLALVEAGDGCTVDGQLVTCALPDVPAGGVLTRELRATVTPQLAGARRTNVATVRGTADDQDATDDTGEVAFAVGEQAGLSLTKTALPGQASVGERVVFRLAVRNEGPSPATAVEVRDVLPAGCTYDEATREVRCALGTVAVGAQPTIDLPVVVGPQVAGSRVRNEATVTSPVAEGTPGDNSDDAAVVVAPQANLELRKTADTATPASGETVVYTLTVTNAPRPVATREDGTVETLPSNPATGVVIRDDLPADLVFVQSPDGCAPDGDGAIVCEVGDLAPGATAERRIFARALASGADEARTNRATVAGDQEDPDLEGNTATAVTTTAPRADVALTATLSPATAAVGERATLTLEAVNAGPNAARDVVLRVAIPEGVDVLEADGCTVAPGGRTVTCPVGTLDADGPGARVQRTIVVTATRDLAGATATLEARTDTTTVDLEPANDTSSAALRVPPEADLAVTKTAAPQDARVGQEVTFTLTATNTGPSTATGVVLRDEVPVGLDVVRAPGCEVDGRVVTCEVGSLADGASAVREVVAVPTLDAAGEERRNAATVSGDRRDPDAGDDRAAATVTVAPVADLVASAAFDPERAGVGETVTLRLGVRNAGPDAAQDVVLRHVVPDGFDLVEPPAGCVTDGRTILCEVGDLEAGDAVARTVLLRPTAALAGRDGVATAEVLSPTDDLEPANDSAAATLAVRPLADLALTLLAAPGQPAVGEATTFTLALRNDGPSPATDVVLTLVVPDGFVVEDLPAGCAEEGGVVRCTIAQLAAGATVTRAVVLRPTEAVAGERVPVGATVRAATDDPDLDDRQATASVDVAPQARLSLEKTASPGRADVGEDVTFTLVVRNAGPNPATGTRILDAVPDGLEVRSAEGCAVEGQAVACDVGTLAVGATATRAVVVRVTPAAAGRELVNAGRVTSAVEDPDGGDDLDRAVLAVDPVADLTVTKSATPTTPAVGDVVRYDVTVANAGPQAATAVTLTDELPRDLRLGATPDGCTFDGRLLACRLGTIAAGASETLTYRVRVEAGAADQRRTNRATADAAEDDLDPRDDTAAAPVAVGTLSGLSLEAAATPTTPAVGERTTVTLTARNDGPNAAQAVVVTTAVPDGFTLAQLPDGCTAEGALIRCELGTLPAGEARELPIVLVPTVGAAGRSRELVASIASPTPEEELADNEARTTLIVDPVANLELDKAASPVAPSVGDEVTFTLRVRNDGPNAATGVTVRDALPADLAFLRADTGCTELDGLVRCEVGDLAAGSTATREVVVRVGPGAGDEQRTNTATVTADQDDLGPADDTASVTIGPGAVADVALRKLVTPSTVGVGETATFRLEATNAGPNAARDLVLRDDVPAGLDVLEVPPSCSRTGQVVTCEVERLEAGATVARSLVVRPTAAVSGDTVTNTATATSATLDRDTGDLLDRADLVVRPLADLALAKRASARSVAVGDDVTFTLAVRNDGPDTATDVRVTDALPDGLRFVSGGPDCAEAGSDVVCTIASIGVGETVERTVVARALAAAADTTQRNVATVAGDEDDPVADDDRAAVGVAVLPVADLALDLRTDRERADVGEDVVLRAAVRNDGPNTARDTVLTLPIPEGLQVQSVSPECELDAAGTTVTCRLGDLAPDATRTVEVQVVARPEPGVAGTTVTFAGSVASATGDPQPADDTDEARVVIDPLADVGVLKTVDDATADVGQTLEFTLAIRNEGPSPATGVVVTDELPAGLALVDAAGCETSGSTVTCRVAELPAGATVLRTVRATAGPALAGQRRTNTATVRADQDDQDPTDDASSARFEVGEQAGLSLTLTALPVEASAGDRVTFELVVRNSGPSTATGVTTTQVLPAAVEVEAPPAGCTFDAATRTLTCTIAAIAADAEQTIEVPVRVLPAGAGQRLTSTASVTSPQPDPVLADNEDDAAFDVRPQADLSLTKTASTATPGAGDPVTYTLTVTNGPRPDGAGGTLPAAPATGVVLTDDLPSDVRFVSASDGCALDGDRVRCVVGDLAAGATAAREVRVEALPSGAGAPRTNRATVDGDQEDPVAANDTATAVTTTQARADVGVTAAFDPATTGVGDETRLELVVRNAGPNAAQDVVARVVLPEGLTLARASEGCELDAATRTVTCTIGSLDADGAGATARRALVLVPDATAAGEDRTVDVTVATTTADTDPTDDADTATVAVEPQADLAVTKTADPATAEVGQDVTFTLTARNDGPNAATGVVLRDEVPLGLDVVAAPGCDVDGRVVTCAVGGLADGTTATRTVVVRPLLALAGRTATNVATVAGDREDPDAADDRAEATVTVAPVADLVASAAFEPGSAAVGDRVELVLGVRNDGPRTARDVTLAHVLPAGLEVVELPDGCTRTAGTITCAVGDLADGATASRTLVLRPTGELAGREVVATVTVDSATTDQDPADDTATAALDVDPQADLSLALTAAPGTPAVGQATTFTLTLRNDGPDPAQDAVATLTVPDGFVFVSADAGCTEAGGTVRCAFGTLADDEEAVREVVLRPTSAVAGRQVEAAAVAGSATDDPDRDDLAAQAQVTVGGQARLSLVKTASTGRVDVGDDVTFTLVARNDGPNPAPGARIVDDVPAGLEIRSAPGCDVAGQRVTCELGTLGVGAAEAQTRTIVVRPTLAVSGDEVVNVATVSSDLPDPDTTDDRDPAALLVDPVADLRMAKTVSDATPAVGDTITYTLTATNDGPEPATRTRIVDALPDDLTLAAVPDGCTVEDRLLTCEVGTVADGATATVTYDVVVGAGAADQRRTNVAAVDAVEDDRTPADDQAAAEIRVGTLAGYSVTVTPSPATPGVGERTSLTVTARNEGPNPAQDTVVTLTLPDGLVLAEAPDGCTVDGAQVRCALGELAAGEARELVVVAIPQRGAAGQVREAVATITSTTAEATTADNTARGTVTVDELADLSVAKAATPTAPRVGDEVTFTLTVANAGPSVATGVTLVDPLPAGLTFVAASDGCAEAGDVVRCAVRDLDPGTSTTREVVARVEPGAGDEQRTNTATADADQDDLDRSDDTASVTIGPAAVADLSLTKAVTPGEVAVGDRASFRLQVTNAGPNAARDVVLRDEVPAGLRIVAVPVGCERAGQVVTCAIPRLEADGPGSTATRDLEVVAEPETSGETLVNVATAASATVDRDDADRVASAPLRVRAVVDLAATKTASVGRAAPGDDVVFTIGVRNDGPDDATGVVLRDDLPAGLALVSASPGCERVGEEVVCEVGDLAVGATATRTVTARALRSASGTVQTNAVRVAGDQDDPVADDDVARATVAIDPLADLSLALTADPGAVLVGQPVTLRAVVRNDGPNVARDAVVTIPVPAGLVVDEVSEGCTLRAGGLVVCEVGDLVADAIRTVEVRVVARTQAGAAGTTIVVTGSVGSATTDPVPADNTDDAAVAVGPLADLGITKTVDDATVDVGDELTFTLTARNAGPSPATGVVLTDDLPAGLTFVAAPGCTEAGGVVTCEVGDLADGGTAVRTIRATATVALAGQRRTNEATVRGREDDQDASDDTDEAAFAVGPQAGLSLTKTALPATASVGDRVVYRLRLTNAGPNTATNVRITDTLPDEVELGDLPAGCTVAGREVTCLVERVLEGEDAAEVIDLPVTIRAAAAGTRFVNTASAEDDGATDPTPADDTDDAAVVVAPQSNLAIEKTATPDSVGSRQLVTYTLTVTNAPRPGGLPSNPATGVTVTDDLPADLQFFDADAGCTNDAGRVTCEVPGTLAPGDSRAFQIRARALASGAGEQRTNRATVDGDQDDPVAADDADSATIEIVPRADVAVAARFTPGTVGVGEQARLVLTGTNDGPNAARETVLVAVLPEGLAVEELGEGCTFDAGTRTVRCAVGTLDASGPGATVERAIVVVADERAAGRTLTARASVETATQDTDDSNDEDEAGVVVEPLADLRVTKTADRSSAAPGQDVVFTLTAVNDGPNRATGVVLTDVLPSGFEPRGAPGCVRDGQTYTCAIGVLEPGASATRTVTARPRLEAAGERLTNVAAVDGDQDDPDPADDRAQAAVGVGPLADLTVTATTSPALASGGRPVDLLFTVTNRGPADASSVVLTATLPDGVTLDGTAAGCTFDAPSRVVTCQVGELAEDASEQVRITVVPDVAPQGSTFVVPASVGGAEADPGPRPNSTALTVTVKPQADLVVGKTADRPAIDVGETVGFTLSVRNAGPGQARGVRLVDRLPDGLEPAGAAEGCTTDGQTVTCDVGDLADGATATRRITARATRAGAGLRTTNTVTGTGGASDDPTPGNDAASADVQVRPLVDLRTTKVASTTRPSSEDELTYVITVTNGGPNDATGVRVEDALPEGLTFVRATPSQGTCQTTTCALGTVRAAGTATVELVARVDATTTGREIRNVARASAAERDEDPGNDAGAATVVVSPAPVQGQATPPPPPGAPGEGGAACSDGRDNDGDGLADRSDPGCSPGGTYFPDKRSEAEPSAFAACGGGRLRLINVDQRGSRTLLEGVAGPLAIGRRVTLRSLWDGRVVARPVVRGDQSFSTTAPLPPRAIRFTNRARFRAELGSERSLELKFARRMVRTVVRRTSAATVRVSGRVTSPLARPRARVRVRAAASCGTGAFRGQFIARNVRVRSDGRYSATIRLPRNLRGATLFLRAETRVRQTARNRKTFPTYTLVQDASR